MADYKTATGRRPDLEALEVNPKLGYIGSRIYPTVPVMEKTGTVYYKTLTADSAAQTSRSSGSAPSRTLLTDSSTSWTAAELIKRYGVDRDEVKQMGGIEAADRLGGMASKRSVLRALEDLHAAKLITTARYNLAADISADPVDGINQYVDVIRRYPGTVAAVFSVYSFRGFVCSTPVVNRIAASFGNVSAVDAMSRRPEAVRLMLQGILGVDEIIVGDDAHWKLSGKEDAVALAVLPDPEAFSHKMDPVLGKTFLYMPDGVQPFQVESFYDEDVKINNYDAACWQNIVEFNAAAAVVVKVGAPTVPTTTTTTTTTAGG